MPPFCYYLLDGRVEGDQIRFKSQFRLTGPLQKAEILGIPLEFQRVGGPQPPPHRPRMMLLQFSISRVEASGLAPAFLDTLTTPGLGYLVAADDKPEDIAALMQWLQKAIHQPA